MKNLNKKIGAVALSGMMVMGGFVANVGISEASSIGSLQAIAKRPNVEDHNFVKLVCKELDIDILISDIDPNAIDSYISKEVSKKSVKYKGKEKELIKKLKDIDKKFERENKDGFIEYLIHLKNAIKKEPQRKKIYRVQFNHEQYLIIFGKK